MPVPEPAAPDQESVWDYPRPPRIERTPKLLEVRLGQAVIASTTRGWRVLETSHPPVYFFPAADVRLEFLRERDQRSFCEWKGVCRYFDVVVGDHAVPGAAFQYPQPTPGGEAIAGHYSFFGHPQGTLDITRDWLAIGVAALVCGLLGGAFSRMLIAGSRFLSPYARFRLGLRGRCWSWTAEQPKPTNKAVPNFEWVGLDAKLGI